MPSWSSSWEGSAAFPALWLAACSWASSTTSARRSSPSSPTSPCSRPWRSSSPFAPRGSSAAPDAVIGRRAALAAIAVGGLAVLGPLLPAYPLTLLTQALIVGILAMSLDVLLGYTGLTSLGHAAYFGVGAYAVAIMTTEKQAGLIPCLVIGVLLAAATAAVFGLLAIRATGTYFLMITLALGMVIWGLAFRWVSLTKGDNGIAGVPRPSLGPLELSGPLPFFYFCLVAAAVAWALMGLLVISPFGLGLKGIRGSESRMAALGYNVWLHKYLAFVIAGVFAGLAGVLWAYYNGFVGPTDVQLVTSV